MADPVQTYQNHTRFFPPFHFFVIPVLLLNVLNTLRHAYRTPNLGTAASWPAAAAARRPASAGVTCGMSQASASSVGCRAAASLLAPLHPHFSEKIARHAPRKGQRDPCRLYSIPRCNRRLSFRFATRYGPIWMRGNVTLCT